MMLNTVILIVILIMCWMASCIYCFNMGVHTEKREQNKKNAKSKRAVISAGDAEKTEKFMHELENLFSYDGTSQE